MMNTAEVVDIAVEAGKFAESKIKTLFDTKHYTDAELSCLRLAIEIGYIAGRRDERKWVTSQIDGIIVRNATGRIQ